MKKFIGNIINFDHIKDEVTFKLDYVNADSMEVLVDLLNSKEPIYLEINKLKRRMKSYDQLKRYYKMLKKILVSQKITPTPKRIKGLNIHIKESLLECDFIEYKEHTINGEVIKRIPLVPSKADMTVDELSDLMQRIEDRYSYLNINWDE